VVADQVLYSGIACLVDLIVDEGLINLDLADVKAVLGGMGTAMLGMGEAAGEQRAVLAAEEAIVNPLLDDVTLKGAKSLLLSITGGRDLTLWEVDEAANRIRQEVDPEANIIVGATLDENLADKMRVAIVASGMPGPAQVQLGSQSDAPVWVPRPHAAADGTSEAYGRRLTEAITQQRGPRGRARSSGKAGAKGRTAAGNVTPLREASPAVPDDAPVVSAKGSGGAKRRGASPRPRPMLQSVIAEEKNRLANSAIGSRPEGSGAGPVGWPEHWVKAGEFADKARESSTLPELATNAAAGQAELPPRRATFFERLAGLVVAKRAG
jgi:cell division protein FtsZ